jgi:hypothetical protein
MEPLLINPGAMIEDKASHWKLSDGTQQSAYSCNDTETHSKHGKDVETSSHLLSILA